MSSSASKTGCFKQMLAFNYNSVVSILKPRVIMYYGFFFPQYILTLAAYASIYICRIVIIILLINQSFYIKFCKSFSPYTKMPLFSLSMYCTISDSKQATLMLQHKDDPWIPEKNDQPHTILYTAYLKTPQ